MSENNIEARIEPSKATTEKTDPLTRKITNIGRRILQIVKRHEEGRESIPEQAFSPTGIVEHEKKVNPERARRISEQGCVVRAVMSATAFASGESNISATSEEWDARFQQIKKFYEVPQQSYAEGVERNEQDIISLFAEYAQHTTPLGNALKQVNISVNHEEAEDKIRARIHSGEQVMVIVNKHDYSHIFHAGLDKKGRIISLSDEKISGKIGKAKYQRSDLSKGTYTTFSVTPQ